MTFKKIILPALVITIVAVSMFAVTPAHAATTNSNNNNNPFSGLVAFIAKTFNLDQTKVQTAVTQYNKTQQKTNIQQKRTANQQTRLDKLVSQGTITKDQETAILAELTVLKNKYNPANSKNLTADQRKQQMQNEQADIQAWSKSTGIDSKYLMPGFGGFGFRGMHNGNWKTKVTPTPTP